MHRRLPWLLALPLMAAGSLLAHAGSYLVPGSGAPEASEALELHEAAHGGAEHGIAWSGLLLALVAAMAILRLFSALRSQPSRGVGALCFFSLPLGAYAAQELIERLLSAESLPFVAGVEPRFLLGLALQLPFAALAFALGWLALRVPHAFRRLLAGRSHALRRWSGPSLLWTPLLSGPIPRIAALSRGHPRAPPQLV